MDRSIIDVHTHLALEGIFAKAYLSGLLVGDEGAGPVDRVEAILSVVLSDRWADQHISQMQKAGVEKSVVLLIDTGIGMGEPAFSIDEIYAIHGQLVERHSDNLIVFGGIDPRRGKHGQALFRKGIEEYGFQGLKLYPPMGFAIDDERLDYYYRLCDKHGLPVLIHTGPSLQCLENHYAEAANVAETAKRFPGVNFILAHAGYMLNDPDVCQVLLLDNVFADIAGFQKIVKQNPDGNSLHLIFREEFASKVMFGTDWPLFHLMKPIRADIELLESLAEQQPEPASHALDQILGENAKQVLGVYCAQ